jgi:hypothetical protein
MKAIIKIMLLGTAIICTVSSCGTNTRNTVPTKIFNLTDSTVFVTPLDTNYSVGDRLRPFNDSTVWEVMEN